MNERSFEYRTGQTAPEKSSRGIIAFLLICVIFLAGLVSLLGMMNIHLFRQLQAADSDAPLSFQEGDTSTAAATAPVTGDNGLTVDGITFQELPQVYQQLHELPAGLYVVDAPENGPVQPGDILTAFDGAAVSTLDTLRSAQAGCRAGDRVWLTFHRQDAEPFSYSFIFHQQEAP